MRKQKKKQRYDKGVGSRLNDDNTKTDITTESVVTDDASEIVAEDNSADDIKVTNDDKLGGDMAKVSIATVSVAILFGIIGYLSVYTDVIDNLRDKLLKWFNLG